MDFNTVHFVTSNKDKKGLRYSPFCFTEHGVIMLASHKEILHKLEKIEHKLAGHDNQILVIFEYLKQLEQVKQQELDQQNRKRVGYKRMNEQ